MLKVPAEKYFTANLRISLPKPCDEPGVPVLNLDKLDVSVPLAGEEDHVGVRVVERNQDPRGHVQGQHMLQKIALYDFLI